MTQNLRKKFIQDNLLNIISSGIPVIVIQLIILPILAKIEGPSNYGYIVTYISFSTLFSHAFGITLNNARLIRNSNKTSINQNGDYNALLVLSLFANSIIVLLGTFILYPLLSTNIVIMILVVSNINLIREYLIVFFRIELNFKKIFINNLFMILGFILGFYVYHISQGWYYIYIVGYSFSVIHSFAYNKKRLKNSNLSILFKENFILYLKLIGASVLASSLVYSDKILILPLLGSISVSIYYASVVFGKMINMISSPISGVLLSYLTKVETLKKINVKKIVVVMLMLIVFAYFSVYFAGRLLLKFIYPDVYKEALLLLPFTLVIAIIDVLISLTNPILLRFRDAWVQITVNFVELILYLLLTFLFIKEFGIIGFIGAIIVSKVVKFMIIILTVKRLSLSKSMINNLEVK